MRNLNQSIRSTSNKLSAVITSPLLKPAPPFTALPIKAADKRTPLPRPPAHQTRARHCAIAVLPHTLAGCRVCARWHAQPGQHHTSSEDTTMADACSDFACAAGLRPAGVAAGDGGHVGRVLLLTRALAQPRTHTHRAPSPHALARTHTLCYYY